MSAKAVVIFGSSGPLSNVEATFISHDGSTYRFPLTNSDGYALSPNAFVEDNGYLKVVANGFKSYLQLVSLDDQNQEIHVNAPGGQPNTIHLPPLSFNKPSRDRIINVMANLCNLRDADDIPIFEPFINSLIFSNPIKAQDWIARLKDAGSTHITTEITGDYNENLGWINRYPIPGMDFVNNIDGFKLVLDYLLMNDLIPIVKSGADGQQFDPVGWTYGWSWGMRELPGIYNELKDYHDQCLWSTSYDGGFADWSPNQLLQFLRMMRTSLGENSCIDTEFSGSGSISYIHLGNGAADWTPDKLGDLDSFSLELQTIPEEDEGLIEVAQRLLDSSSPVYYRNSVQKTQNIGMYETVAYWAIRKQISPNDVRAESTRIKQFGYTSFGNGLPE